ncbi:hypothetical protein AB4Z19_18905 [Pseudoduganella sp. RAF19]|uniref:hypothetical protein n=1 Tax=Pseudoduganella sp. RAF19 TaxID=3233052 RepID=UPI003F9B083E
MTELSQPLGVVILRCDGHEVTLTVQRFKAMAYRVMTYVNGKFNQAWCHPNAKAPESKYLRKSVRQLYSAKERERAQKDYGKRMARSLGYFDSTYTLYLPDWPSGRSALSHLCQVCESVEVEFMGYEALKSIVATDAAIDPAAGEIA